MEKDLTPIIMFIVGVAVTLFAFTMFQPAVNFGSGTARILDTYSQSRSTMPTSGKTTVVEHNSGRRYLLIQNMDATNFVYLHFGDATSTITDYKLFAKETYTISQDNLYLGKITGLADTAIVDLAIVEAR